MFWGNSPPLDLQNEIYKNNEESNELNTLDILIVGGTDARHIIKTLSECYCHQEIIINFHSIEATPEAIARSILQLDIALDKNLGLLEASRYFLEILGNTLLTPATGKHIVRASQRLIKIVTQTFTCSWLNLEGLKYKDRDLIEGIFKFWSRALCDGVPILDYWDRRIRKNLKTRYDYRDGVFDWDYNMILKDKNLPNLTIQEYKFWRNNGVAFTWIETDPSRSNPTLLNHIIPVGGGFIHYAYQGDITNGPFFTWALDESEKNKKLRATDVAEKQIMKSIYQIRSNEICPDNVIAAHRDSSILDGTLVTQILDSDAEQEPWKLEELLVKKNDINPWIDLKNSMISFYLPSFIERCKTKEQYKNKFNVVFIANNMTNQLPNLIDSIKKGSLILIESRKFMTELRKEDHIKFSEDIQKIADDIGLKKVTSFDSHSDIFARFIKE